MQSLPKISVLVPAYNEEKYIRRTLTALAAQDYPGFEIIVCDNASTDCTALLVEQFIAETYASGVSIRLVTEQRKGTNFAREHARLHASGSVIAQLDADCTPARDWLRKGIRSLLKHPHTVAVTGPYDYTDGNLFIRTGSLLVQKTVYPLINLSVQKMGRGAILIGGNAFIRSQALETVGGYDTSFTFYGDDVDLGRRLAHTGHVRFDSTLVMASSSRRYKAQGFRKVNKQYQACFWNMIRQRGEWVPSLETSHPR